MTAIRKTALVSICVIVLVAICSFGFYELVVRRPVARDDPSRLWIAALKGFEGTVWYVGDQNGYSFFVTGTNYTPRYKRLIRYTNLPEHFPLGSSARYRVTQEMVPQYNSQAKNDSTSPSQSSPGGN